MSQGLSRSHRRPRAKTKGLPWLHVFSWASLVAAFIIGLIWQQPNYPQLLQQTFPNDEISRIADVRGEQYQLKQGDVTRYLSLGQSQGYGGPMLLAVETNEKGRITSTILLEHKETPGYINRFRQGRFYRQFDNQLLNKDYQIGLDIDGLSGATLSSQGLTSGIRAAAHNAAERYSLPQNWQRPEFIVGYKELLAVLLFVAALIVKKVPRQWQKRYNQLLAISSVVLIGYWLNSALSITMIGSLLLGYIPSPQQHLLWYIMLTGSLGSILFLGRNVYCTKLCPFHQIQRWLHQLSGLNLQLYPWLKQRMKLWTNALLWLSLMLIFLSRTPAIGSYEPFSMLFSLEGVGIQWYILPLSIFGAFVVNDFWCRMLCPLGRFLTYSVEMRAKTLKQFRKGKQIAIKDVSHEHKPADKPKKREPAADTIR
ncbi:FMN-binding protein [Photobacterium lipolyticum]|uniref:FMN-binding domain-containing protein n=1 Tax=Photobacterium lipolyticum TaxID=266810 RepID=A0A2T3N2H7_9GAMM|nr:FMN-binding protein [Photobacterium lipolyticum]PSW06553.1 hypothetical protein C9I89_03175 [Photobacterium lipolyticum]